MQIENPMDIDSFNVLLNCSDTWVDSHNLDGAGRETCFRLRDTSFGSCNTTVKAIRNRVTVAMGTTSVLR